VDDLRVQQRVDAAGILAQIREALGAGDHAGRRPRVVAG
jgi:hypothetical protein